MIKKRIKSEDSNNINIESSDLNNNDTIRTFKDQAIKVLNILESQGIFIYNETNYGGMYLNNSKSKNIDKIFESKKTENKSDDKINDIFLEKLFNK